MRACIIFVALLVAAPALAANQIITVTEDEQKALPPVWDGCIKQGGLACVGLYNFYVLQKPQPEPPTAKPETPTAPPAEK